MRHLRFALGMLFMLCLFSSAHAAGFDVDSATRAYLDKIPAATRANSDAYFTGGYWLQLVELLYGFATAYLLLATRSTAKIRDRLTSTFRNGYLRTAAFIAVFTLIMFVLNFPISVYTGFIREHNYGFATQNFGEWLAEAGKGLALNTVFSALGIALLYSVVRKLKNSWWLVGAFVSIGLMTVMIFISPIFIEPIFNAYKPMPAGPVKTEVLRIAQANSIPTNDVMMVDASKQTKRVSANVSGIGSTVRIALNDNLLNRASPNAVAAVMGHEMGHYVLNHVLKFLLALAIIVALGFKFVDASYAWASQRWGNRFAIRDIGDEAGLPLVMVLLSLYFFLATPLVNTMIRTQETEADFFGLNASQQPDGFAEGIMLTAEYRKAEPSEWEEILFYDHPSPRTRVRNAMQWKAQNLDRLRPVVAPNTATATTTPTSAPTSASSAKP